MTKKAWGTPEMTVLARGKPEEAVLFSCKKLGGGGPVTANTSCLDITPCGGPSCDAVTHIS